MIQILYEIFLVITDRSITSLSTHEKSSKLYDSYNVYPFDNLQTNCTKNLNGIKKRTKEYQWHPLDKNGVLGICQSIAFSKITNLLTLEIP